jgi:hypothetical protein
VYLFHCRIHYTACFFFFFQSFEQQSAASHSRHAVRQHAQPPSAVSTLSNTFQSSNSCQHVYNIIGHLNLVFRTVSQMTVLISGWSESVLFRFRRKHNCLFLQIERVIGVTDCGVYGYLEWLSLVFQFCLFGHYFWALLLQTPCRTWLLRFFFFRIFSSSVI